ncbi:sulfurtransferase [Pigmentiphaga litoralis]|nr:sulfurtransferase [Pigmentiphaga litoralis]
MTLEHLPVVVNADWLARHLTTPGLRIVDASWSMGGPASAARYAYQAGHLPGAVFLDLDATADPGSSLPHALAPAQHFGRVVGALGIGNDDAVVIYDRAGMHTGPRAWWLFKAYGHDRVAVLDGGLPRWLAAGRPIDSAPVVLPPRDYLAADPWAHACTQAEVLHASQTGAQIVDARSPGRYRGDDAEPRPGLRSGHIPGSRNLPYTALLDPIDGTLLPAEDLQQAFERAGVDPTMPVICTCGSGVTACVIRLALARLGAPSAMVYDGSWTEWGSTPGLPVATGP